METISNQELKELVFNLAKSQVKTDQQISRLEEAQEQTNLQIGRLEEAQEKTDQKLENLSEKVSILSDNIGGLANKFGGFTEGMAFPSMTKLLEEKFTLDYIQTRVKAKNHGKKVELDVYGYANSTVNQVVIVEVKSLLKEEHVDEMQKKIQNFKTIFPQHEEKKVYAILAYVDYKSEKVLQQAEKQGFYLACIHDDVFSLSNSPNFEARAF